MKRIDFNKFEIKHVSEIEKALDKSEGMLHREDYIALSVILRSHNIKRIFEIGTFKGVTSNFFLNVLPNVEVVSISLVDGKDSNNKIGEDAIGSQVEYKNRERFTQLYGDSHELSPKGVVNDLGRFDMVFIDGDHSLDGVIKDTELAEQIITPEGLIVWHDANPKEEYKDVEMFLEEYSKTNPLVATLDTYIGGIAVSEQVPTITLER